MKTLHQTKSYTVFEATRINGLTYIAIGFTGYTVVDLNSLLNVIDNRTKKHQAIIRSVARRFAK